MTLEIKVPATNPKDFYVATRGVVTPEMTRDYEGEKWFGQRPFVFLDLAGHEVTRKTKVGQFGFNDIGHRVLATLDDLSWLKRYAEAVGNWHGSKAPALIVFRYMTGCYGALLPSGRLHAPYSAMMSSPWTTGIGADHHIKTASGIMAGCNRAGVEFGVYFGTSPIMPDGSWWNIPAAVEMTKFVRDFGAQFMGHDYISGAESTSGKPAGANWADDTSKWPNAAPGTVYDPASYFPTPKRQELAGDKFMLACQAAAPGIVMAAESGRDPGRAMYQKVGMLRMVNPLGQNDHNARFSPFDDQDHQKMVQEGWQRQYLNRGVPQFNLLDGDWNGKAPEFALAHDAAACWPGNQIPGGTVWAYKTGANIDPMKF